MNPICDFCQTSPAHAPVPTMEQRGIKVYFCTTCDAEYIYFRDGTRCSVSLYTKLHDKTYRWTLGKNSSWL